MASNKIQITLASVFQGEGFNKANTAVKGLSKNVKDATEGFGKLSGELGGINGTVGKVADGIGKLFGALSGGPIGLAIAGVTLLVSIFSSWKESTDEAARKQHEMMAKMEEGYRRRLCEAIEAARKKQSDFFGEIVTKGNEARAVLERLAGHLTKMNSIRGQSVNAQAQGQKALIDGQLEKDIANGGNREILTAQANLKKVQIDNAVRSQ